MVKPDGKKEHVQAVERGLNVLLVFDETSRNVTLTEVSKRTGLTRATARRFLLTLVSLGMVGTDGKYFWLEPRVLEIGFRYLSSLPWWRIAQPIIEETARQTKESTNLAIIDRTDIIYVSRAAVNRILTTNISIGSRLPAYCTAMGRAILAYQSKEVVDNVIANTDFVKKTEKTVTKSKIRKVLEQTRIDGVSLVDQELEVNLLGIAVPVFDATGKVVAALGCSVHAGNVSISEAQKLIPILKQKSQRITEELSLAHIQAMGTGLGV